MLDNHLNENCYVWHERNVQGVIRAVTGRPVLNWRVKKGILEEETDK